MITMSPHPIVRRPSSMTLPETPDVRAFADALLANTRAYVDGRITHEMFVDAADVIWRAIPRELVGAVGAIILDKTEPPP